MHSVIDYRIPFQHVVVGSTWIDINFSLVNFFFFFRLKLVKLLSKWKTKRPRCRWRKRMEGKEILRPTIVKTKKTALRISVWRLANPQFFISTIEHFLFSFENWIENYKSFIEHLNSIFYSLIFFSQPTGKEVHWVQCDGGCEMWFHMR